MFTGIQPQACVGQGGQENMEKTVGMGHQDFEVIRQERCFYIDKTLFLKEWWQGKDAVTLITDRKSVV